MPASVGDSPNGQSLTDSAVALCKAIGGLVELAYQAGYADGMKKGVDESLKAAEEVFARDKLPLPP